MTEKPKPRDKMSWSRRGYKTIYVTEADKAALREAAAVAGFCTIRDYVMDLHLRRKMTP